MDVTLTIRCPSGGRDVEVKCQLEWSIHRLKMEIQDKFESHPDPDDQRLVYAGKLLENPSILESVLRPENQTHIVHMVCRNPHHHQHMQQQQQQQQRSGELRHRHHGGPEQEQQQSASGTQPQQQQQHQPAFDMNAWTQMLHQHQQNLMQTGQHQSQDQQQAYMQQMYAQYMAQYLYYMQSAASAASSGNGAGAQVNLPAAMNNMVQANLPAAAAAAAINNVAAAPAAQPAAAAQNNAPAAGGNNNNNNVVMNAGAGAMGALEDEDEFGNQQRDALDWVYILSRLFVLVSIVWFYSSALRFALVAALTLLAWMYNNGMLAFRRNVDDNNNNEEGERREQDRDLIRQGVDEVRRQNEAQGQEDGGGEDAAEQAAEAVPQSGEDEAEAVTANQNNVRATAATFLTTFFTSLLPERPAVI